jgi:4-hydroxy-3-polyprenylbenzoate decarboxylase
LPENIDEYMLAGFLRQKNVKLVKCLTNEIYVPQDADFIIEGYVDVNEDLAYEGPFGDHTGYYSLADYYPLMHITCITHRRDAVYPATVVGIPPQEDEWLGKATERIFLSPIRLTMNPEVVDMALPTEGVFHNIALVSIQKEWEGQALKVMNSLWGAGQMMFNKVMVVVNHNVNVHDYQQVLEELARNVDVARDVHFFSGPADVLDHAMHTFAFGGKLGIDATQKPQAALHDVQPQEVESLLKSMTELSNFSLHLMPLGILLLAIRKSKPGQVRQLHQKLLSIPAIKAFKAVVYAEDVADLNDFASLVWRVANNIDPARDCFLATDGFGNTLPLLAIDGTRKYAAYDGFGRLWPNIVTMDTSTIHSIDKKWPQLGLGPFIPSPSLKYISQLYAGGAVAEE